MGVIQCVGSMLLSLVGLVYGCVVFILENQSLAQLSLEMLLPLSQITSIPHGCPRRAEKERCEEDTSVCASGAAVFPCWCREAGWRGCLLALAEWYPFMVAVLQLVWTEQFQQNRSLP